MSESIVIVGAAFADAGRLDGTTATAAGAGTAVVARRRREFTPLLMP